MADPLSVAATVVGLLRAAAQISQTLYNVTKRAKKAPKECKDVRTEVDDIRNILSQLQLFVLGAAKASTSRTSLILVEQVVATLAATVTTFSELDVFVETLDSDEKMGLMDRLRWLTKEKDLKELLQKLQLHKSSMGLMLTILTCRSTIDAEEKVDKLCDLVEQTLKQNVMLAERLSSFQSGSTVVHGTNQGTETGQPLSADQVFPDEQAPEPTVQQEPRKFAFEELLMHSRVYQNMAFDGSDTFSILSSAGRTGSWSMLSGLSLSQMSNIAILALPVYATDLSNKERYDFDTITEEPVVPTQLPVEDPPKQSSPLSHWWEKFRTPPTSTPTSNAPSVMSVPLADSVRYAGADIRVRNEKGDIFLLGYIPDLVAQCGIFLKEKGTTVENIFATPGHPARVRTLEQIFNSFKGRYGKKFPWEGFTIHDSAALLLRYLKCLPEPVIPYNFYAQFTSHFRTQLQLLRFDHLDQGTIDSLAENFLQQIVGLPQSSRCLLLYLLDLLDVFASESDTNNMLCPRLVSVFHPAIISRKPHEMDEAEHRLAQDVVIFLVKNHHKWLMLWYTADFQLVEKES